MSKYSFLIISLFVILSASSCKRNKIHKKNIVAVDTLDSQMMRVEKPILAIDEASKVIAPVNIKIDVKLIFYIGNFILIYIDNFIFSS